MFTRTAARRGLVLAGALTVTAVIYAALPGATLGSGETRANATTLAQGATVARDADGDYVVAWSSTTATDGAEVYFQRFDAKGAALGDETVVNTTAAGSQAAPSVAMDATGSFAIVWAGNGIQTDQADATGVFLQRFDAEGAPLGEETRVNTTTTNTQDLPAVAMDADGDFVVVWQSLAQDGSGQGVYAQRFDAAGAVQGSEFQVNAFTTGSQRDAAVAMDFDGNIAVVWESNGQDGSLNGVYARLFDADGTEAVAEFRVNTITAENQENPAVGRAGTGGFVVAWSGPDGDGSGIYARRFDSLGSPLDSSEFDVNSTTTATQAVPAIALDADGDFVVAWESNSTGNYDIVARRYAANGTAGGEGEFTPNSTVTLDQRAPAVALDADGDSVVAWQGNGAGDANGLFARRAVGPQAVDLSLTKTDSPDPVVVGNTLTYTITVANLHPAATSTGIAVVDGAIGSAAGVIVSDTLPSGFDSVTLIEATGEGWDCTNSAGSVTCALGSPLPADSEAAPLEISVLAPAVAPSDRTIVNTASVSSAQYDDVPANDTGTNDTVVCGAGESPGTLNVTSTSAGEAAGTGAVTVTRAGGACGAVSVQVNLVAGTAATPADFTATSPQTLEWANGETGSKSVATPVTIVSDSVYESNETVAVTLSNAVRATAGTNGTLTITDDETAPSLVIADNSAAEGNAGTTLLPLTVTLTPAAGTTIGRDVTVEFDTANGTATLADVDYVQITDGSVTFTPGQAAKAVNVTVNGDVKDEADETLTVTLSNPSGATLADATATGTITNDDVGPAVFFAATASAVSEAGTGPLGDQPATHTVQVSLSTASSKTVAVTVGYAGTATMPADYSATPTTTVTFSPGVTSQNVTLTIAIDALDENDETASLTLSAPNNATLGAQAGHVVTINDDDATPTVSAAASPTSIAENANPGTATFTVALSAVSGRDVNVTYGVGGTATLPNDYTVAPAPGVLTIPAGALGTAVTVTLNDDSLRENNETVVATLSAPVNATLTASPNATLTINDDDPTPTVSYVPATQNVDENVVGGTATVTLQLSAVSGRDVIVPFTVNPGTAQANDASNGTDFTIATSSPVTIPAGSQSATITINIVDDASNENNENIRLGFGTLINANVGAQATHVATIVNEDTLPQVSFAVAAQSAVEDDGAVTVTVELSRAAEQDVTINYTLSGTALDGTDYAVTPASPFLIAEGESSGELTITPVADSRVESDETATLTLSSAVNGSIPAATKTHTVTLTDDDAAGVAIVESGGSTDVLEGGAGDSYMLVLTSEPTTSVTVSPISTGQATVTASVTFTPSGPAAWNIPQTVTVSAVDDMAGEGTHADTITHAVSSADADYDGLTMGTVGVTIADNDVPAVIVQHTAGGTTVVEGGATDSYTVVLSAMPAQEVTVNLAHDGQVSVSDASLTFTPGDWNQPQGVTVTAVNDPVAEGTHLSTIMHASDSTDPVFDALAADLTVQLTDNDTAGVVLSKTSATAAEGGAGDSYTLRLNSQPIGDVVVGLTPNAQVSVSVTEIVFNAVNWNMDVAANVAAVNDTMDEPSPHSGLVVHNVSASASDANYDGIAVSNVAVAVTDNDAPPAVTLSLAGSPLAENGGIATVTATLSAVSGQAVTVNLALGGTASAGTDYAAFNLSVLIPAGQLTGARNLSGTNDLLDEPNETITVDISSVTNGTESGVQQVIATIVDDDAPPSVTLSASASTMGETGGSATLTATLSGASTQDVTVSLGFAGTATNPADYTASGSSITITAGSLSGSITLTSAGDVNDEPDETVIVDVTAVTNGTESGTQTRTVTITDDDATPSSGGGGGAWDLLSLWLLLPALGRRRRKVGK